MNQSQPVGNYEFELLKRPSPGKLSLWRFLLRYPFFMLAIGPPIFRPSIGIDATKGDIDFWAFLQVAWIGAIAARAIFHLAFTRGVLIPRKVRSILGLFIILGILFLASAEYSPSRLVSAAYAVLYFLTVICIVDFVAEVYKNSFDWMQCLFHFRTVLLLLLCLVVLIIPINPTVVMVMLPGIGIRLLGGTVAPIGVICPLIAIISAYTFLFSLESKARSALFFLIGMIGTFSTQARGGEIALVASLLLLGILWAETSKRSSYLFIASAVSAILLAGLSLAAGGGSHVKNFFIRGETIEGIESASGRTDIWKFVMQYCSVHPLGMGYIAGFRKLFREYFALGLPFDVSHIGNAHNTYMDVLADAGWAALAVYLILLIKIVALGWRYARKRSIFSTSSEQLTRHVLRCALILLVYCLICGTDAADFCIPLRSPFYLQNIVIAMILGSSANLLDACRIRRVAPAIDPS